MTNTKRDVVNELHAPARKNFKRRHVLLKGLHDLFQADLVEMRPYSKENKGYNYILMVINAFSKYAWAWPLKSKSATEVTTAMEKILLENPKNIPKNLQTDNGKEFYNGQFKNLMLNYGINHYSTYSNLKSSIVERFNRTLKEKMWKEFSMQGNYKWLDLLPKLIKQYNNTKHSTLNMKPSSVNSKNAKSILTNIYNRPKVFKLEKIKFKINDPVRISKYRHAFAKNYTPNWTNEIFRIYQVQNTNPPTYKIKDSSGEVISGGFYQEELQKVKHPEIYLIERILKKKGNKILVKWLGLPKSENSWILKTKLE